MDSLLRVIYTLGTVFALFKGRQHLLLPVSYTVCQVPFKKEVYSKRKEFGIKKEILSEREARIFCGVASLASVSTPLYNLQGVYLLYKEIRYIIDLK